MLEERDGRAGGPDAVEGIGLPVGLPAVAGNSEAELAQQVLRECQPFSSRNRRLLALLPWQHEPVRILAEVIRNTGAALDASDTGVGKTYHALFAAKKAGLAVAVICPKSVIPSWREAAARAGVPVVFIRNIESLKRSPFLTKVGKYWHWTLPVGTVLIFDEVHRFSAPNSANARILAAAPKPVLMLSATAADNPGKLRAIGHQLGLTSWSEWWSWCGLNGCRRGRFGGLEFVGGERRIDKLHQDIFESGRGVRVRISELGNSFPKNSIETISVPVADQRAIDAAYLDELNALESGAVSPVVAMQRARQIAEHNKLPALMEMAEDLVESGRAVVIFVNFRDSLVRLNDRFGCASIHGDQTAAERQAAIERFRTNKAHVCAAMIQAGGCGLDGLQDLSGERPRVSLVCPGWSAIDLRQALGRIHRVNSKSPALQRIVFAEGTLEERIRRKVNLKLARIDTLNDGDLAASHPIQLPDYAQDCQY